MRKVAWALAALDDFASALTYIAAEDPQAAALVASRTDATARNLAELPAGRPGRVHGTYEKVVARTRYIVTFALSHDTVTILRIIHGSRHWPDEDRPE